MADLIGDLSSMLGIDTNLATRSTNKSSGYDLSMEDFLNLMIVQLTSQTIDDTMDTNEMMNQMVQMQMVTAINNLNDISIQSYANSLVGQDVTVGIVNGNTLEERVIRVMGTGTYNGQQVIFGSDGNMYYLSQIMAVGILPDENGKYDYVKGPGSTGDVEDSYVYTDDEGNETTVYVGEDGKAGTEDDWYYVTDEDGEVKKRFVGPDGVPGTEDDWYEGEQGVPTD